jgi:hypothetical protein
MAAESSIEKELLALENRYWQGVKDRDIETCLSLTDDPCLVAGAQGVASVDRESFKKIMGNASYTLHNFKLTEPKARLLSDDVAILAYEVHEELTVDGKPVKIDTADASTWVKRGGKWLCAMHTESLHGDPYGRDRKATH